MGTWSIKPFGNDAALDWLDVLGESKDESVLELPLETVLQKGQDADDGNCCEAIAAAAIIQAACCEPIRGISGKAKQWITVRGYVPTKALIRRAIDALEIIIKHSEMRDLWEETDSFPKWQKEINRLINRLRDAPKKPLPVREARKSGVPRLLHKLIKSIDPNDNTAARKKAFEKLRGLLDVNVCLPGWFMPPLHACAERGLIPEVSMLLDKGADINLVNETCPGTGKGPKPLNYAAYNGHAAMVEMLLKRGAKLWDEMYLEDIQAKHNVDENDGTAIVYRYNSALWDAVKVGSIAVIETLVRYGADLHQLNPNGGTLIHEAAQSNQANVIEYLVVHSIDINKTDDDHSTALFTAMNAESVDSVYMLLNLGADPNIIAKYSHFTGTPLDVLLEFSISNNRPKIEKLLRQHGGKLRMELEP